MTERFFYQDPYATALSATVTAIDGDWVALDRSVFYPQGGGQPGDTGWMGSADRVQVAVADTRKGRGGTIWHRLEGDGSGWSTGERVELELDWKRRYRHMRMHTCLHLLGSLIPCGVTGGAVGEEKSRLDFDAGDQRLDKEQLTLQLNELIEAGHPVQVEWVDEAVLDAQPDLVRTMSVEPPRGVGVLRMIRIAGVDYQPCGGTHVANTSEIGSVRVAKIENKGKRNRRVQVVFDEAG